MWARRSSSRRKTDRTSAGPKRNKMPYLSAALNVMTSAARKAGRKLIRDFGEVENLKISVKGPGAFVSVADNRTESILFAELQKARAGYPILAEESGLID